ncbi:hypothetical protein AVEN_263288-1 [Araneus ventricosus]|uniref:Uncharacterized protein n=1 Tax=Araneus ventricosus TaxID=182803 RepID=A0A4Y2L914_ARAVE|nr:hypothetical protein AVEN_263288-1 [Araneus ventricosus]
MNRLTFCHRLPNILELMWLGRLEGGLLAWVSFSSSTPTRLQDHMFETLNLQRRGSGALCVFSPVVMDNLRLMWCRCSNKWCRNINPKINRPVPN